MAQPTPPAAARNTFVLCFDGTGNKFSGTDADSNILKIYRMLDKTQGQTYHYYQPGIGTYVTSSSLEHTSMYARFMSAYDKMKDSAVGTSFATHVMGGYRFLMRFYQPGDDIYFFGFSRGAYTARFLAEMLDHVGLLSAGNEELTRFAWKTFSKWQSRRGGDKEKESEMYEFMKNFRETFSRPVRRIRFLGLFDTVNSVPKFESAWMQRSKFPYTARSSAKVIRHAVSINERRAKFRQDLISSGQLEKQEASLKQMHRYNTGIGSPHDQYSPQTMPEDLVNGNGVNKPELNIPAINLPSPVVDNSDAHSDFAAPMATRSTEDLQQQYHEHHPDQNQYRHDLHVPSNNTTLRRESMTAPMVTSSIEDMHSRATAQSPTHNNAYEHPSVPHKSERLRGYTTNKKPQDIEEVWFPGCHADIGGGWEKAKGEKWSLSHMPLVWLVQEAEAAGLKFDRLKMADLTCCPDKIDEYGSHDAEHYVTFHRALQQSGTAGFIHDCLEFGGGLPRSSVLSWKLMEYLPFRRMDLQKDGSWVAIRYPLPGGETRDIPNDAKIHNSAIKRMKEDAGYRPGNLIVGGGGRGVKVAPKKAGIGEWDSFQFEGCAVKETYIRRMNTDTETERSNGSNGHEKI